MTRDVCAICRDPTNDQIQFGDIIRRGDVVVHYFCLVSVTFCLCKNNVRLCSGIFNACVGEQYVVAIFIYTEQYMHQYLLIVYTN